MQQLHVAKSFLPSVHRCSTRTHGRWWMPSAVFSRVVIARTKRAVVVVSRLITFQRQRIPAWTWHAFSDRSASPADRRTLARARGTTPATRRRTTASREVLREGMTFCVELMAGNTATCANSSTRCVSIRRKSMSPTEDRAVHWKFSCNLLKIFWTKYIFRSECLRTALFVFRSVPEFAVSFRCHVHYPRQQIGFLCLPTELFPGFWIAVSLWASKYIKFDKCNLNWEPHKQNEFSLFHYVGSL